MKRNTVFFLALAIVTGITAYLYFTRSTKSFDDSFADFSVKDTAQIDRIFIADTEGKTVLLKRTAKGWTLNDSLEPRPAAVELILRAFRDITIQSPVAKSGQPQMLKVLAASHKKVEIYQGGDKPVKIWYVGAPTQDHFGTHMLLEIPGKGRAKELYVTELPWHRGFITPMFFTNVQEWRNTNVFRYPQLDFAKVTVKNFEQPEESFSIEKTGDNQFRLLDLNNRVVPHYDTLMMKDYLEGYKKAHYESLDKYLKPAEADSMLKSTPIYEVSVTEKDGRVKSIRLYKKYEFVRKEDMVDETPEKTVDINRAYGFFNNEIVLVQYFNFGKLLVKLSDFKKM